MEGRDAASNAAGRRSRPVLGVSRTNLSRAVMACRPTCFGYRPACIERRILQKKSPRGSSEQQQQLSLGRLGEDGRFAVFSCCTTAALVSQIMFTVSPLGVCRYRKGASCGDGLWCSLCSATTTPIWRKRCAAFCSDWAPSSKIMMMTRHPHSHQPGVHLRACLLPPAPATHLPSSISALCARPWQPAAGDCRDRAY